MAFAIDCAAARVEASAFLEPPGQGDIIATTEFSDSTRYFDQNGRLIPIPAYEKFELGTYIEYGLTEELTLVAQPFFDSARQETTPPMKLTTGGTEIGLRAGLANFGDTILSVQGFLHIPFSSHAPIVNFDESSVFSGDLRLLLGHSFTLQGSNGFLDVEGGYRWQADNVPNEWHADVTIGLRPKPEILMLMQSFATLARGTPICPAYSWVKLQESLVYDLTRAWSVQGGFFETVAGMNAGRELGPLAGVWYRF